MNTGTRTYFQGIWEFPDFQCYLREWIIPYTLQDLKTIFEGSRHYWQAVGCPQAGRGDFLLSTTLFALLDHLGSFMGEVEDSLSPRENIARCARMLDDTKDVDLIIGHFGRNALVHRAWPQTIALMDRRSWAFGLNVTANPNESDHLSLYWKNYQLPGGGQSQPEIPVLKLRMNVAVLRRKLEALLSDELFATKVKPEVFRRICEVAIHGCNEPFLPPEGLLGGRGLGKGWKSAVEEQIRELYRRAQEPNLSKPQG